MEKKLLYEEALVNVDILGGFLNNLIVKHGEVKAVKNDFSKQNYLTHVYHDYIYYCFSKSSRSIYSAFVLAKEGLREDSLIILRTVYENYLRISYTLKNPNMIHEFVYQEVGLRTGAFIYKNKRNGLKNYSKVINVKDNKEFDHGTSVKVMAQNSINLLDEGTYTTIYRYLSEHTHPNMLASGNYRSLDNKNYVLFPTQLHLELPFFINFLCFILIDAMYYYHTRLSDWNVEGIDSSELDEFISIQLRTQEVLLALINNMDFNEFDTNFAEDCVKRIRNNFVF